MTTREHDADRLTSALTAVMEGDEDQLVRELAVVQLAGNLIVDIECPDCRRLAAARFRELVLDAIEAALAWKAQQPQTSNHVH
jgi:hypothetical protein